MKIFVFKLTGCWSTGVLLLGEESQRRAFLNLKKHYKAYCKELFKTEEDCWFTKTVYSKDDPIDEDEFPIGTKVFNEKAFKSDWEDKRFFDKPYNVLKDDKSINSHKDNWYLEATYETTDNTPTGVLLYTKHSG